MASTPHARLEGLENRRPEHITTLYAKQPPQQPYPMIDNPTAPGQPTGVDRRRPFESHRVNRDKGGRFSPQRQLPRVRGGKWDSPPWIEPEAEDWHSPQWTDSLIHHDQSLAPSAGPPPLVRSPRWKSLREGISTADELQSAALDLARDIQRRDEEGKFTGGGGSAPSEAGAGARPSHRKEAPLKQLLESPEGYPYMKDEDGNAWRYSEKRNGWVPSQKDPTEVGGSGWHDNSKALGKPRATAQTDPVGMLRALQAQERAKRILPRGPRNPSTDQTLAADHALRAHALTRARQIVAADQAIKRVPLMAFDWAPGAVRSQYVRLAFDRASMRSISPDGHLHVALSNISRAQVSPYWGREVPDAEKLGLDPDRKYMLLRPANELQKAAQTFNGIPILIEHKPISADDHPHELTVGATGTDARWEAPFLKNSLHIWAKPAIDAIMDNSRRELSCAYHYTPLMVPGIYEGKRYDGVMTRIAGNHLALVEAGRVGPAAIVADAMPFDLQVHNWLTGGG